MHAACCDCVSQVLRKVQKGLYKGLCTPQGPLRTLVEANTGNPSDPWAILNQTNKNLATWNLFSIEGASKFTEHLKRLWDSVSILPDEPVAKYNTYKVRGCWFPAPSFQGDCTCSLEEYIFAWQLPPEANSYYNIKGRQRHKGGISKSLYQLFNTEMHKK